MIQFDKHLMPRKDKPVWLGFSGGADSLAAAHFLKSGGWDVRLLHVKHFVTVNSSVICTLALKAADSLGLECTVFFPNEELKPSEAAAYAIRHEALSNLPHPVILCNHLNDLAEGYFINCQQGFPDRVPLVAVNGNKIRPFLRTKKKDFEDYLQRKGLTHLIVPDPMISLRGKLRTEIFPRLGDDWTSSSRKLFVDSGRIYVGD